MDRFVLPDQLSLVFFVAHGIKKLINKKAV